MKKLLLDLFRILALASLLALGHLAQRRLWQQPSPSTTSLEAFQQNRDTYQVVDARTDVEFQSGHIPGAISLPVSEAMLRRREGKALLAKSRSKPVLVYCDGADCKASAQVGIWLREQGYTVSTLSGGYPGWMAAQKEAP